MNHVMKLHPKPFSLIAAGKKTIEMRLLDEKRQQIKVGDTITFLKRPDLKEQIETNVIDLHRFHTFLELVNAFPMSKFGYPQAQDRTEFASGMGKYYSKQDEEQYGMVGIEIARKMN